MIDVHKQASFGKKAQFSTARKTIYWMIAAVMITVLVIAFTMLIAGYKNKLTAVPPKLKAEMISLRFTNIPECFAYQSPPIGGNEGKVYPGTIDLMKFTSKHLNDSCYSTEKEKGYKDFNFGFTLVSGVRESTHTNNYFYIGAYELSGPVAVFDDMIVRDVLVFDGGRFMKDQLRMHVQKGK